MITKTILLNSITKVKNFINEISKFEGEADIVAGRYLINAKSVMGIFSIDITEPITLNIHASTEEEIAGLDLSQFIYPQPDPEPDPEPTPDTDPDTTPEDSTNDENSGE